MEPRREAQVPLQEKLRSRRKAWQAKHPWVCGGGGDGERRCRMPSVSQLQDSRGLSQLRLSPCRVPVSLHHVLLHWDHTGCKPWALSADVHSFLAKDCNGAERPGLGSPALAILAQASFSAQVCRVLSLEVGLIQSCKTPPWPAVFP